MIEFSIPDSAGTRNLNVLLIEMMKQKPEIFYDDFKITSTYGTLDGCTWNGGRDLLGILSQEDCENIIKYYNDNEISYRYTFTNKFLEKRDFYDRYSNMLLRINKVNNGVTYNKESLKKYIRKKHPTYYFVASCTKNIKDIKAINKLSKEELMVLDFRLNNSLILGKLRYPHNIEIVVNEQCMENCPFKEIHYSYMSKKNLFVDSKQFKLNPLCERKSGSYEDKIQNLRQYVSRELIYKEYLTKGINKFKIVGRHNTMPDLALYGYLDYFIKPEYKKYFIEICKLNNI